jgi:hypothetical protein
MGFPESAYHTPISIRKIPVSPIDFPPRPGYARFMKRGKDLLAAIDSSDTLKEKLTLQQWMRENHDGFAARLTTRFADWVELVKLFAEAGLTDRYGRPPKPETARKTWQRVRTEVKAARAKTPPLRRVEAPQQVQPVQPADPAPSSPSNDLTKIRALLAEGSRKLPDPIR